MVATPFTFLSTRVLVAFASCRQLGRDASVGDGGGRLQRHGVTSHQL